MKTKTYYQVVITAKEANDLEAAYEAADELKQKFPNVKVEIYESKTIL